MIKLMDFYVTTRIIGAFTIIGSIALVLVLLQQLLHQLDLVALARVGLGDFLVLILLYPPFLLLQILPLIHFASIAFVYRRLIRNGELIALEMAGLHPLRIARPAILFSVVVGFVYLGNAFWLSPLTQRMLARDLMELHEQSITLPIWSRTFIQTIPGVTLYAAERVNPAHFRGLMIEDTRDPSRTTIMTSEDAYAVRGENTVRILMRQGRQGEISHKSGNYRMLQFDEYVFELQVPAAPDRHPMRGRERYLSELLDPEPEARNRAAQFRIEAHYRAAGALFPLAFAMMTLAIVLRATAARYHRIRDAIKYIGAGIALQALFLASRFLATRHPDTAILIHAVPVLAIIMSYARLGGFRFSSFSWLFSASFLRRKR